jgi:precorrin-6B methylase 2
LLTVALREAFWLATTGEVRVKGSILMFGAATGSIEVSLMLATPSARTLAVLRNVSPGGTLVLTRTRTW